MSSSFYLQFAGLGLNSAPHNRGRGGNQSNGGSKYFKKLFVVKVFFHP